MAKAVIVHGVPTNWKITGVADCAGKIMGEVIGVRWLLNERRREGKAFSSVVVYLRNEVFLGLEACMKMSEKRHSVVVYRWRACFQYYIFCVCGGGGGVVVPEVWSGLREDLCCYTGGSHEGVVVILEVREDHLSFCFGLLYQRHGGEHLSFLLLSG